ncbi:hypothetical protein MRX96_020220 [Rhipicephalus microplus]
MSKYRSEDLAEVSLVHFRGTPGVDKDSARPFVDREGPSAIEVLSNEFPIAPEKEEPGGLKPLTAGCEQWWEGIGTAMANGASLETALGGFEQAGGDDGRRSVDRAAVAPTKGRLECWRVAVVVARHS